MRGVKTAYFTDGGVLMTVHGGTSENPSCKTGLCPTIARVEIARPAAQRCYGLMAVMHGWPNVVR